MGLHLEKEGVSYKFFSRFILHELKNVEFFLTRNNKPKTRKEIRPAKSSIQKGSHGDKEKPRTKEFSPPSPNLPKLNPLDHEPYSY